MTKTYTQAEEDRVRISFKVINILSMRLGDGSDDPQLHIATREIMGIIDQLIATTRRETVEEMISIIKIQQNPIKHPGFDLSAEDVLEILHDYLDQLSDKQEA